MRRVPADPVDHDHAGGAPTGRCGADLPPGLLEELQAGSAVASAASQQRVAHARHHVAHARLDDDELLQGIAISLLADSARP